MRKMSMSLLILTAALVCVSVTTPSYAADEGVKLFENASIDDFDFFLDQDGKKADVFSFTQDNVLKISGTPFGWLSTKKSYKNFTLKVEICHPDANIASNSGLFLRIGTPTGHFLPPCIEVQMKTGNMGDLFGFVGYTVVGDKDRSRVGQDGKFHGVSMLQSGQKDGKGAEVWNLVELTCYESTIIVRVNGKIVNYAHNVQNVEGPIGFQSEGGPVWYRNAVLIEEK